ncbi:YcgL domain [Shigella sonnei]|nr:YcgL domain [Shigella sonnei]
MFCVIYRSSKRDQTYLYVEKKDDFSGDAANLLI